MLYLTLYFRVLLFVISHLISRFPILVHGRDAESDRYDWNASLSFICLYLLFRFIPPRSLPAAANIAAPSHFFTSSSTAMTLFL